MSFRALLRLGLFCGATLLAALAQDPATPEPEQELTPEQEAALQEAMAHLSFPEQLQALGVKMTVGPVTAPLGTVAEIQLPEGYHFVGTDGLELFYQLTENMLGGDEVGVVIAPEGWMLFFDFEDIGYVKDDEKNSLDADALMESMTDGQEAANSARRERGWDEMRVRGWVQPPHYDEKSHNLKWAFNLSSSSDDHQQIWINQNIRLLGRSGVMNVTLVGNPANFAAEETAADALLADGFTYVAGERYAEFKEGDKIAKYGLAALVLGGAGAVAAKTGILAKFWKFIVIGVLAVAGFLKNLWNRITGSQPVATADDSAESK